MLCDGAILRITAAERSSEYVERVDHAFLTHFATLRGSAMWRASAPFRRGQEAITSAHGACAQCEKVDHGPERYFPTPEKVRLRQPCVLFCATYRLISGRMSTSLSPTYAVQTNRLNFSAPMAYGSRLSVILSRMWPIQITTALCPSW